MCSTNYFNTFIEVAEDCPVANAEVPPQKVEKTAASIVFEMVTAHPYQYSSDELIFHIHVQKKKIADNDINTEKERFFS